MVANLCLVLLIFPDVRCTQGVVQRNDDAMLDHHSMGLREILAEVTEEFQTNLIEPGMTVIISVITLWSFLRVIASSIGLLTQTESMKTNILLFLHHYFVWIVHTGVETAFYDYLYEATNPVLANLFTRTRPITQLRQRRHIEELTETAFKAFNKYGALQK